METLIVTNNFTALPVSNNIQIVNVEQSLLLNLPSDLNVLIDRNGISTKQVLKIQDKFTASQLLILNSQDEWMNILQSYNTIELEVKESDLVSHIHQLSTGRFVFSEEELNALDIV